MDIKTKFIPKDKVWVMLRSTPHECTIFGVVISSTPIGSRVSTRITYNIEYKEYLGAGSLSFDESEVFATKEELKQYIISKFN